MEKIKKPFWHYIVAGIGVSYILINPSFNTLPEKLALITSVILIAIFGVIK